MAGYSEQYKLMIYFAVATLYFYRIDIVEAQTVEEFLEKNSSVTKRVFDEALSLFGYELSYNQKCNAVACYIAPGQSITATEVATIA